MSILVVAEKPSVAKDIAKVLGCSKKGDGFLYGNNYIVSWAIGHLVGLYDPEEYDEKYKKWRFDTLPIMPQEIKTKTLPRTKPQYEVLKKLISSEKVTELICATDSGREGELIFRYIYNQVGIKKPFKRLWISSMTDSAVKKGFASLKDGKEYDNLYLSAKCRSEADWLVGINASRAYTIKYGALLTIGRVQTPTLSLLVANKKEIEAFVPTKYFEVQANFTAYQGTWFDPKTNETKMLDEEKANEIAQKVKGKNAEVADVQHENKKLSPPYLFDLTELQRESNRKFGYSAKKTLDIAQDLYEKRKVITYPRTDSRFLTDDMAAGIQKVLESLRDRYGELLTYPLSLKPLPITKRIADNSKVTDHHAIIPTGKNAASLTAEENAVFDLIAKRLIAAFYPDYTYKATKVITVSEHESFISRGTTITNLGWKAVLGKEKEEDNTLPELNKGDCFKVKTAKVLKKATTPPKPYNDATLLSAMENAGKFVEDEELKEQLKESGLGTPATRAAIIERLIEVGYVKREKKTLSATEKAVKLIEIVPKELKSPETTAKWERALSSIAKGKMETEKFNKSIEKYVYHIISESKNVNTTIVFEQEARGKPRKNASLGKCPLCDGAVLENTKAYYCTNWKGGCKFTLWKNSLETSNAVLSSDTVKLLLKEGKVENFPVSLESTKQRGSCTLKLEPEKTGYLSIVSFMEEK